LALAVPLLQNPHHHGFMAMPESLSIFGKQPEILQVPREIGYSRSTSLLALNPNPARLSSAVEPKAIGPTAGGWLN
jgi:hypothetical protein